MPPSQWEIDDRRVDPGLRDVMSVEPGRHDRLQDQVGDLELQDRHPAPRLLRRQRRADDCLEPAPTGHVARSRRARPFADTGLIDCGNWAVVALLDGAEHAVSGVYIAHLVRNDTGGDSHITFVVRRRREPLGRRRADVRRDLAGVQQLRRQQPLQVHGRLPTGQRRGLQGGVQGLLQPTADRRRTSSRHLFNGAEYNMIRFLEANGYDVSYISGVDTHRRGVAGPEPQAVHLERPRRVLVGRRSAPT